MAETITHESYILKFTNRILCKFYNSSALHSPSPLRKPCMYSPEQSDSSITQYITGASTHIPLPNSQFLHSYLRHRVPILIPIPSFPFTTSASLQTALDSAMTRTKFKRARTVQTFVTNTETESARGTDLLEAALVERSSRTIASSREARGFAGSGGHACSVSILSWL